MRLITLVLFLLLPNLITVTWGAELSNPGGDLEKWTLQQVSYETVPVTPWRVECIKLPIPEPEPMKVPDPPPDKPVNRVAPAQVRIPSHGSHWTHPSTIKNHLMNSHGYNAAQLSGLSHEQLLNLHDSDHEGRRVSLPRKSYSYAQASPCPGGVCPVQSRQVQRRNRTVVYQ